MSLRVFVNSETLFLLLKLLPPLAKEGWGGFTLLLKLAKNACKISRMEYSFLLFRG